jgi:hypothetical protein
VGKEERATDQGSKLMEAIIGCAAGTFVRHTQAGPWVEGWVYRTLASTKALVETNKRFVTLFWLLSDQVPWLEHSRAQSLE